MRRGRCHAEVRRSNRLGVRHAAAHSQVATHRVTAGGLNVLLLPGQLPTTQSTANCRCSAVLQVYVRAHLGLPARKDDQFKIHELARNASRGEFSNAQGKNAALSIRRSSDVSMSTCVVSDLKRARGGVVAP